MYFVPLPLVQWNLDLTNLYNYNKVLGITNDIFQPSNSVMYGKEPRYNEPISLVPWHFVKSRVHCTLEHGPGISGSKFRTALLEVSF